MSSASLRSIISIKDRLVRFNIIAIILTYTPRAHPGFSILRNLVFIFISVFAIVSLSSSIDPSFAILTVEKDGDANGKLYFIDTKNNDPLSTIFTSRDVLNYTDKGDELFDQGKYDQAIAYYDKALAADPNDYEALYNKGVSFANLGKYEEAITYFDKALAVEPNDVDTLSYKGTSLESLGKHEEAITYFDKALAVEPDNVNTLNWKGYSLYNSEKYDDAITYFDKVLEIDPHNEYAKNLRAFSSTHAPHSIDSYFITSTSDVADEASSNITNNKLHTFRDSKTKVSFQYPPDWEVASDEYIQSTYEGDSEGIIAVMLPKSLDGSSMSIQYEKLPFPISANEFVEAAKKDLKKTLSEEKVSMSDSIPVSIGSLDGYKYNITKSDETFPNGVFVQTQVVFIKNSKLFIIAYSLAETDTAKVSDIESMLDSFQINNSNKDNVKNEKVAKEDTQNDNLPREKNVAVAKAIVTRIFDTLFPETGKKFTNTKYGVDIAFPKNWTGFEIKVLPAAVVSPEGFNFTSIFSTIANDAVNSIAENMVSDNNTDLSEQKTQELTKLLSDNLMNYFENATATMGVIIYDKEFTRLINSVNPNNTMPVDSLTSIYEHLAASDSTVTCNRKSLDKAVLNNNISAEVSTEQCILTESNKRQDNLNYFVLTPNAIIVVQYSSDPNKENDNYRSEFEESLKSLSVEKSLPINNQTIQRFLSD